MRRTSPKPSPRRRRSAGREEATLRTPNARGRPPHAVRRAESLERSRHSVDQAISEVQQTRIALLRSTIELAQTYLRHACASADRVSAMRGLQHARDGYELARRLLATNTLGPAQTAGIRAELSALRRSLDTAERQGGAV